MEELNSLVETVLQKEAYVNTRLEKGNSVHRGEVKDLVAVIPAEKKRWDRGIKRVLNRYPEMCEEK